WADAIACRLRFGYFPARAGLAKARTWSWIVAFPWLESEVRLQAPRQAPASTWPRQPDRGIDARSRPPLRHGRVSPQIAPSWSFGRIRSLGFAASDRARRSRGRLQIPQACPYYPASLQTAGWPGARLAASLYAIPLNFAKPSRMPSRRVNYIQMSAISQCELMLVNSGNGSGDGGLRRLVQFDDRQSRIGIHEAQQTQRIFQGRRVDPGEADLQWHELPVQGACDLQPPLPFIRKDPPAEIRRNVGNRRDTAIASAGKVSDRGRIVPGQEPKVRGQQRTQAHGTRTIARSVAQPDELTGLRQPRQRVVGQLADRARRDVVQDDRQPGRIGNRTEMRDDAGLHRFIVVRHD